MAEESGWLPNYGANDGALFFKLNDSSYRDYRPQLAALAAALNIDLCFETESEDLYWYGLDKIKVKKWVPLPGVHSFDKGGYYIFREKDTLTFIRCGNHKDRPSQADNLHLDIWYKGENILLDSGSYKYNTDKETLKYFMGTASHNTVMLDDYDQMKKGSRFIWYNWTQVREAVSGDTDESFYFKGVVSAFTFLSKNILHQREVKKEKGKPFWIVTDTLINKPVKLSMKQLWHLPLHHFPVVWKSWNVKNDNIKGQLSNGYVSPLYGMKERCEMITFQTMENRIVTDIEITET
jgi:hypothetical protein